MSSRAQVRDFLADRRELVIGDDGDSDPLTIVYRPGRINSEYTRRVRELAKEEASDHKVTVFAICTLVSDWDLKGPLTIDRAIVDKRGKPQRDEYGVDMTEEVALVKDGEKIPIKSEFVKYLPMQLLGIVVTAIFEDMKPDPQTGSESPER